ncbi:MAG: cyclodeaminase/cyclohydrolase family protein [Vicinamibacterales bacterium]
MTLTAGSVSDLLAAFRSPAPTPGGGSAAALAGAVGASLLTMVAGLARPRTSTDEELASLQHAGLHCARLALSLEASIDKDTDAYNLVVTAYRLPKSTPDETGARSARIQVALKAATEVPLEVMRHCSEALSHAPSVARLGNQNAASDVNVAIGMLRAGLSGAGENVDINLGSIKDAEYVSRVRDESSRLATLGGP